MEKEINQRQDVITDISESIKNYVGDFFELLKKDTNGRYKSYEHCRSFFLENRKNEKTKDLMALHLYSYLASWGMLRNSFLMQKDYLFNLGIVEILYKDKYDKLLLIDFFKGVDKETIGLILDLSKEIRNYYLGKSLWADGSNEYIKIKNVTDTLVTKIIMGTFACVPAFDRYFMMGLKVSGHTQKFGSKSICEIWNFILKEQECLEKYCNKLYTPMKIVDMYFWELGMQSSGREDL